MFIWIFYRNGINKFKITTGNLDPYLVRFDWLQLYWHFRKPFLFYRRNLCHCYSVFLRHTEKCRWHICVEVDQQTFEICVVRGHWLISKRIISLVVRTVHNYNHYCSFIDQTYYFSCCKNCAYDFDRLRLLDI